LIGPPAKRTAPTLNRALRDTEKQVRLAAATALVRLDPQYEDAAKMVLESLPEILQSFEEIDEPVPSVYRVFLAEVLGALGPRAKDAEDALTDALEDKNEKVQAAALEALQKIRKPRR